MDVSRQEDTSCTSTSMYLSFDAESTVSSAAFRTLEASTVSEMEDDAGTSVDHSQESHMNSTLEAKNSSQIPNNGSQLKTVNRADPAAFLMTATPSPFPRAFPKNILQEYKALCSTPTKEQLLRNVETVRGSSAEGCIELGMSFLNMDDQKQQMCFPPPLPADENKENAQESEEGSISLVSTSVEIVTSVIEQKVTLPTATDEKSLEKLVYDNVEIVNLVKDVEEKPQKAKEESKMAKDESQTLGKDIAVVHKSKRSILAPKNIRKSVCEPDLKANRPTRILLNAQKRTSLSACPLKTNTERDQASEIPKLIDKLLKISDAAKVDEIDAKAQGKVPLNENRMSMVTVGLKPRSSKLPTTAQAEKRPFNFTQRMSIVVKTTLNSPARKIARRSALPNPQAIRKSILPKTLDAPTTASASTTGIAMRRKSMLPVGKTTTATVPAKATPQYGAKENDSKSKLPTTRQSLYPQTKPGATPLAPKLVAATASTAAIRFKSIDTSKANLSFICSVCSNKFSLKSLLNAHLRSHEDGIPTFVKKPLVSNTATTASTQSLSNSENQCKYCDKKFALVRALHIHLLQNCAKIPPKEKRKLQFTELNHVEKAQLPAVFHINAPQQLNSNEHSSSMVTATAAFSLSNDTQLMMPPKSRSNVSSATMSSTESLAGKKDITVLANELVAAVDGVLTKMGPPSAPRAKKKTIATAAHSGLYRTPTKSVPCHLCKKTFKSILEFTNHSMTLHSTSTYSTTVCTFDNNSSGECGNKSSSSPMDLSSA